MAEVHLRWESPAAGRQMCYPWMVRGLQVAEKVGLSSAPLWVASLCHAMAASQLSEDKLSSVEGLGCLSTFFTPCLCSLCAHFLALCPFVTVRPPKGPWPSAVLTQHWIPTGESSKHLKFFRTVSE